MKLLVSALEPSANIHLEPILKGLKDTEIVGIFDEKFGEPLYKSSEFSVMGILDVVDKIGLAKVAMGDLMFLAKDVDAVLLIDSPAFNLPLAKSLKLNYPDLKIYYYILPKVWAWKKGRAKVVDKYVDRLCSIFPFEDRFYKRAEYVGNPIMDEIKEFHDGELKKNIAFLPGSREGEIKRLMPIFKEVAKEISYKKTLVIPRLFSKDKIEEIYGDISEFEVSFDTHKTLLNSDFAFVCSGTATLESAVIGTPFVLVYKARKFDFWLGRKIVKLPYVGLANILLDFEGEKPMHKELLQDEVTVENMMDIYEEFERESFEKGSTKLRELLGHGSCENVIKIIEGEK